MLSGEDYLRIQFNHTFCVVAPGDWISTVKSSQTMVIGGRGGCIPVIVTPDISRASERAHVPMCPCAHVTCAHVPVCPRAHVQVIVVPGGRLDAVMPYTRWLDYCEAAVLVSEVMHMHMPSMHMHMPSMHMPRT